VALFLKPTPFTCRNDEDSTSDDKCPRARFKDPRYLVPPMRLIKISRPFSAKQTTAVGFAGDD